MNIIQQAYTSDFRLPTVELSKNSSDILEKMKKLPSGIFSRKDHSLINELKTIKPVDLTNILNCFFMEWIQKNGREDPIKMIDRISSIIPLEKLQEAVNVADVLEEAKNMFEEANHYLKTTEEKSSSTLYSKLSGVLDGIIAVIESIIAAFGLGDFFAPSDNSMQADFKSHKIISLISLFGMISSMVLPLIGLAEGGLVVGGILLAITALSIIWPHIKPMPTHLPANAKNWTKQIQQGTQIVQGRKESLDEIANILKMNRHPILVGPSRVGKSLTAKAFAQAIERGDYPEFKGMKVFRINATDFLDQKPSFLGGGNNILKMISDEMGRYRHRIILVLDEVHKACQGNIADQLKTFLDEGGEFPHVIGITTNEEYVRYVKDNNAFSLRFDPVAIKNTSVDETLKILSDEILINRSNPIIEQETLEYIYNQSGVAEAPQPSSSIKLLKKCIIRTGKLQLSPTEKRINELTNHIFSIHAQSAATRGRKKEIRNDILALKKELAERKEQFIEEKKEAANLFRFKDVLDQAAKETYRTVLKASKISHKKLNFNDEKLLKRFLLTHEILYPLLETYIKAKSKDLNINIVIDQDLIDDVKQD